MVKKQLNYDKAWYALAITRIMLGFVFLWAFFDKLFGFGVSTVPAKAWLNGGSPTAGFLGTVDGPFQSLFASIAGLGSFADWLFMLGLLGVGVALVSGAGLRIAAVAGGLILVLMWLASLPIKTNPFVDSHIIYASIVVVFAAAPRKLSLANWWISLPYIKKNPWLW
ncbi:MAG: hypothetical protein WBP12_03720 [Candidatus Saccharimonas sp.]